MNATVDSVGLLFPKEWIRFPLETGEFEKFARTQRDMLKDSLDLNRTAQRRYEVMLQALRNDMVRDNVRLVATLARSIPSEEPEETSEEAGSDLLAASCIVSKLTRKDLGADVPLTINTIMVGMSRGPKVDGNDDFTKQVNDLEPPEVVDLPAGQAVRLIRLHEMRSLTQPKVHLQLFVQHFLMPLDDTGENAVIVTFSSPSVEYARPISDMFNSMMQTFRRFSGEDDLTDPTAVPTER